jgi:hypothetical protein
LRNNTNVPINEVLSNPFILVSFIGIFKNPKIQIEYSHLIGEPHVTPYIYIFDWALYDNNISKLLEVCPNLTHYAKTFKFSNMFPNIKKKDQK